MQSAFHGLCVQAGKAVLAAMMQADRIALCGPKGMADASRRAVRDGSTPSAVVLGGQRIAVRRPRARDLEDGELSLPTFEWAAAGDPLDAATMAAVAAGVSMRRYRQTLEPLAESEQARSASKSATSRRYLTLSTQQLAEWLPRSLHELELPVVMIDGIHLRGRVILVALGIDDKGNRHVLGLREGSTEATRVVRSLLGDLAERRLDADRARLWVIDGGKALRRAIGECFGALYRTLRTANPIENLNGSLARYTRNVKRRRDGQMTLRWIGSALGEAKDSFRRLRGHRDMNKLIAALDERVAPAQPAELKAA